MVRPDQFQALGRLVTVNLLHIELAHEVDGVLRQHLAGHHDREARRIGNDEVCRHQIRPLFESLVDLGAVERHVFA